MSSLNEVGRSLPGMPNVIRIPEIGNHLTNLREDVNVFKEFPAVPFY